jgi:hypothetical protein
VAPIGDHDTVFTKENLRTAFGGYIIKLFRAQVNGPIVLSFFGQNNNTTPCCTWTIIFSERINKRIVTFMAKPVIPESYTSASEKFPPESRATSFRLRSGCMLVPHFPVRAGRNVVRWFQGQGLRGTTMACQV